MSIHSNPYQLQDQILDFPIYAPIYIWFSFILWNQLKNYKNRLSFWNDRVSIDFCGCCRFEMTIFFAAKSFLNGKRYDCRLDSQQRASNPLSSFQKDGHLHFEEIVIHHIEEKSIPSFRKERGANHFEMRSIISKRASSIISKGYGFIISKRQFCLRFIHDESEWLISKW